MTFRMMNGNDGRYKLSTKARRADLEPYIPAPVRIALPGYLCIMHAGTFRSAFPLKAYLKSAGL